MRTLSLGAVAALLASCSSVDPTTPSSVTVPAASPPAAQTTAPFDPAIGLAGAWAGQYPGSGPVDTVFVSDSDGATLSGDVTAPPAPQIVYRFTATDSLIPVPRLPDTLAYHYAASYTLAANAPVAIEDGVYLTRSMHLYFGAISEGEVVGRDSLWLWSSVTPRFLVLRQQP